MKKIGVLFLVLLLCFSLVTSQDTQKEPENTNDKKTDINALFKDFEKIRSDGFDIKKLVTSLNKLSETDKAAFFTKLQGNSGIDFSKLSSATFDNNGNLKLKTGQTVDLADLYNYGVKVQDNSQTSYKFRGKDFSSNLPAIKNIKVDDNSLTYEFDSGATIKLGDRSTFDFENQIIKIGKKDIEWMNMKGDIDVTSKGIKTKIIYDKNKETNLKSFPIFKDINGDTVSSYHGGRGVNVKLPTNFKKPGKGKFKTFEKNGKVYSVASDGGIRELRNIELTFDKLGDESISSGFIDKGDQGDIFTTGETLILVGGRSPDDKGKSYVWFGKKEGQDAISLNSIGTELYFVQKKNLEDVELNGNVVIKNGGVYISSDKDGNIKVRKVKSSDGKIEFTIDKLYTEKNKEKWFVVKEVSGKIVITTSSGVGGGTGVGVGGGGIIFGGGNTDLVGIRKVSPLRSVTNLASQTLNDLESQMTANHIYRDNDKITWGHETMHGLNSRLRQITGGDNPAAFYLGNGDYVSLTNPSGVTLGSIANEIPSELRGMSYNLYLVQARSDWNNQPLYVLDEFSGYTAGSQVRSELGITNTRGETVQQMMEFTSYSMALLNKAPNNPALKNYIGNRIQHAMKVYKTNQNVDGATNYINKLKNNQWFINSANKHFGSGWVQSTYN